MSESYEIIRKEVELHMVVRHHGRPAILGLRRMIPSPPDLILPPGFIEKYENVWNELIELEQALERIAEVADNGVKVQAIVQQYMVQSEK